MALEDTGVVTANSDMNASMDTSSPADVGDSSTDVNWSDMALEMDSDVGDDAGGFVEGDAVVVESSENESSTDDSAPATPPTAEQPATAQPPQTPPAQVPAPQAATPPTTPPSQEPPAQPSVPYAEWRGKQIEGLEKHYAFDEDTSTRLLTEPETVLPQLAAKLHMEVVEHVMRSVMAAVPQWIDNHSQSRTREADAEQVFYSANPDLKDPAYKNAVLQMGMAYRQMNPNAPAEEAVKVIGNMVRSAMGMSIPTAAPQVSAPAAPAPAPFTPARGGGGSAAPAPTSNNPWAAMAEEFLQE